MYFTVHSLELITGLAILASGNKSTDRDSYSLSNTGNVKPFYAQWTLSDVHSHRIQVDVVRPGKTGPNLPSDKAKQWRIEFHTMVFRLVRWNFNGTLSNTYFLLLPTDGVAFVNADQQRYSSPCQIYCMVPYWSGRHPVSSTEVFWECYRCLGSWCKVWVRIFYFFHSNVEAQAVKDEQIGNFTPESADTHAHTHTQSSGSC